MTTSTASSSTTSTTTTTTTSTHDGHQKATNVPDALQQLLPDLDWTFLTSRTKTLSAKALENLRQKNNPNHDDDNDEPELGERAVEAVAEAMERYNNNMTTTTPEQLRTRAAQAALDRLTHPTTAQEEEEEEDSSSKEQPLWKL
eukprot:scaffold261254_cov32-Attheya_sp.AAC.1